MNTPNQINVQIGEKESEGVYSNLVLISHSASEFVLDFARVLPGTPRARVHARIVMTPMNAKALLATLEQNLKRFEETFGKIPTPEKTARGGIGFHTSEEGAVTPAPDKPAGTP